MSTSGVPSTRITRLREKGSTDRAVLDRLLDTSRLGHVGLVVDGHPVVIPTAIARDGDSVLVHGSTGSGWLRRAALGAPACLTVTALDGLVVARSAFESSMHYRSAVLFGTFIPVPPEKAEAALDRLTENLLPGRVAEIRRPTSRELAATLVLALPIARWSLNVSDGWPDDAPEDIAGDACAGVIPLVETFADARPAPNLRAGTAVPASLRRASDVRGQAGR
jgi:nitroimidazol reductase NimA-like FMN-containing flavoprotein (pyridoxamine 5'-phosphate oxidase superfamily)